MPEKMRTGRGNLVDPSAGSVPEVGRGHAAPEAPGALGGDERRGLRSDGPANPDRGAMAGPARSAVAPLLCPIRADVCIMRRGAGHMAVRPGAATGSRLLVPASDHPAA